jgi:hypothetical protein
MEQPHLRPVTNEPPTPPPFEPPAASQRSVSRPRASKSLPTDRLKFEAQVELLGRFARLSGHGKRAVTSEEVAQAHGVSPNTASLNNGFYVESGWLERTGRGRYVATDALLEYSRRVQFDPSNAAKAAGLLAAPARNSWYWRALEAQLQHGHLPRPEALVILSSEADAVNDYRPQLENILEWLRFLCLISTEGDNISLAEIDPTSAARDDNLATDDLAQKDHAEKPDEEKPHLARARSKGDERDVVLALNFELRLTSSDLAALAPDQIRALYDAVGAVAALTRAR